MAAARPPTSAKEPAAFFGAAPVGIAVVEEVEEGRVALEDPEAVAVVIRVDELTGAEVVDTVGTADVTDEVSGAALLVTEALTEPLDALGLVLGVSLGFTDTELEISRVG
jgi:hypothetical protein